MFDFDRKSWRENMIESHEEKSCRLFNQAIYIYLISCWIESSFRVKLLSQASQLNSSAWIQLLNSTQHFFKKISTRLDAISLIESWITSKKRNLWSRSESKSSLLRSEIHWIFIERLKLSYQSTRQNCMTQLWLTSKRQIYKLKAVSFVISQIISLKSVLIKSQESMH